MFLTNLQTAGEWFEMLQATDGDQTAIINLAPGQASAESAKVHPHSDQVLVVVEGEVIAEIGDECARLKKGDLVVVPAGIYHRFRNDSSVQAQTVSVYAAPAVLNGV